MMFSESGEVRLPPIFLFKNFVVILPIRFIMVNLEYIIYRHYQILW